MNSVTPTYQQLIEEISKLPTEALPELANFLSYLQYKSGSFESAKDRANEPVTKSTFLLSIAGIGASEEDDLSERDEEILASEIDPIHGWGLKQEE